MMKIELSASEKEVLSAYRAMQRALGILIHHVHPSDPERIVTELTNSMDALCKKWSAVDARSRGW